MSTCLDLVLLGHDVSEADLLRTVETKIGLFVDLRGPIGIGRDVGVLQFQTLLRGICERSCGAAEAPEMGEGRMRWSEERHCCCGDAERQLSFGMPSMVEMEWQTRLSERVYRFD